MAQLVDAGLLDAEPQDADADAALRAACRSRSASDLLKLLCLAGVSAAPAYTTADLPQVSWIVEGKYLEEHSGGDGRRLLLPGRYARFSRTERSASIMPPGVGEHTTALLSEAGLSRGEIAGLFADGVIAESGPMTTFNIAGYR